MDPAHVSVDLWERIIDFVGIESNADPCAYSPDVVSCCLVCSLWLPRSRYNLYQKVAITEQSSRSAQTRVYCLARTVCESSDIAHLINQLHLHSKALGRAIPLVVAALGDWVSSMVFLGRLELVGIGWHPALYCTAVSRFPALAHLELRRVAFDTASHLFHLVWNLPRLVSLTLYDVTIRKLSRMKDEKLRLRCPHVRLEHLRELSIYGNLADEEYFPPPGAFGKALRKVYLEFSSRHWHKTRIRQLLQMSTALEEFHACMRMGGGGPTPDSVCTQLMSLLIKSTTIRVVKLDLLMMGGSGVCRSRMIDALLVANSRSTAHCMEVQRIQALEVYLLDESFIRDFIWWTVDVQEGSYDLATLWLSKERDYKTSWRDHGNFKKSYSARSVQERPSLPGVWNLPDIIEAFKQIRKDLEQVVSEGINDKDGIDLCLEWDTINERFNEMFDNNHDTASEADAAAFTRDYTTTMLQDVEETHYETLKDELANFIEMLPTTERNTGKSVAGSSLTVREYT